MEINGIPLDFYEQHLCAELYATGGQIKHQNLAKLGKKLDIGLVDLKIRLDHLVDVGILEDQGDTYAIPVPCNREIARNLRVPRTESKKAPRPKPRSARETLEEHVRMLGSKFAESCNAQTYESLWQIISIYNLKDTLPEFDWVVQDMTLGFFARSTLQANSPDLQAILSLVRDIEAGHCDWVPPDFLAPVKRTSNRAWRGVITGCAVRFLHADATCETLIGTKEMGASLLNLMAEDAELPALVRKWREN